MECHGGDDGSSGSQGGGGVVPRSSGVEEFLGGSSPAQGLWLVRPGMRRLELLAATSPRLRMGSQSFFFFFFPSFSMDGQFDQKGKLSPSPSWMVLGGGGGYFFPSLLTLEDQAAAVAWQGGSQGSPRPGPRPTVDGQRFEASRTPSGSGQFPGGFAAWCGHASFHV